MRSSLALCAAGIVGLALAGRAGAQSVDTAPADQPPPESPAPPPSEAAPGAPPEAPPGATTEAPAAAAPATPPEAAPAAAGAAAFGEAGHFAISIERAFGVDHISATESNSGQDVGKTSATNFSLFGAPSSGATSVFSFPRVALDLFVAQDFSVGLGLGVIHGSTTSTPSGGNSTDQSFTGVIATPRVGYAWHVSPDVTLWPRVGVSVIYLKSSSDNGFAYGSVDSSAHFVAASIELPLLVALGPRVALTIGPTLDITFNGSASTVPLEGDGGPPLDERITEIGIQAGLLIDF